MAQICAVSHILTVKNTASGAYASATGTFGAYIDYSISDQADKAVVTAKVVITAKATTNGRATTYIPASTSSWQVNGVQTVLPSGSVNGTTTQGSTELGAASVTINKTHSVQNVSASGYYVIRGTIIETQFGKGDTYTFAADNPATTISISAKTTYTISYNANGGSGAPASQTKWHGETLKLQTGTPTRTGWTFKGWATSSTATTAAYAAGANYTGNATATLYAVWQRNTYTVSYNANGGTGAPGNQTKQYGIDLTLSNTVPTFSGWTFKGWATSTANASAGTVNYAKGGTYQGNTAITLYAVWELTYKKPTLSNISVERCLQSGDLDDDGDCALVTADWTVFRSSLPQYYGGNTYPYANNAIAQDGYVVTAGTYTETRTPTGESDDGYSVVVGSGFDSDTAYAVTISITDTQTIVSAHTTTATGTLPTQYFPMDYNVDATAVGFFMPAPKSGEGDGAYFGKDIHVYVDTSTASGTDAVITQALSDLDWTDDVLE